MENKVSGKIFSYLAGICMFFPAWFKFQLIIENIRDKKSVAPFNVVYFIVACFLIIAVCSQNKPCIVIGLGLFAGVNLYIQVPTVFADYTYGYARVICLIDCLGYLFAFLYALCILTNIVSAQKKKKLRYFWILPPALIAVYPLVFNAIPCLKDLNKLPEVTFFIVFNYVMLPIFLILFFVFAFLWIFIQTEQKEISYEPVFEQDLSEDIPTNEE